MIGCPAEELVTGYGCALDARDWPAYRALFTDTVTLDYGATGSLVGPIAADDWVERCRTLEGFDATLHRITNLRCVVSGEAAAVDSYVDALHFIAHDGTEHCAHLVGRYRHTLVRDAMQRWRISGCSLAVSGYPGGRTAFVHAFDLARARFAQRSLA